MGDHEGQPEGRSGRPPQVVGALTGVRAVMGLWVVADHLYVPMVLLLAPLVAVRPLLSGGIALDAFFILSGFVISHVYADRLAVEGRRGFGAFLWARLSRLYPTYLFALASVVVLLMLSIELPLGFSPDHTVWTFAGNLLMLQAVPGIDAWNPPSWSVSTEFGAYLVFPFAAAALVRPSRRRALVLAAGSIFSLIAVVTVLTFTPFLMLAVLWVRPLGEIVFGCLLWAGWRRGVRPHWRWDVVAVSAFTGVLLVAFVYPGGPRRSLTLPLLGVLIFAVASSRGAVQRFLSSRPLNWAGRSSYSRYLMHIPVLAVIWFFLPAERFVGAPLWGRLALVALWFAATFGVGALIFRLVEEPARRWMRVQAPRRARAANVRAGGRGSTPTTVSRLVP